jgi:hypothetical protein
MTETADQGAYRQALSRLSPGQDGYRPEMGPSLRKWLGSYQLFWNSVTGEMIRAPEGTVHPDTGQPLDTYLSQHDREEKIDFELRKQTAFYLGLPSEIIDTYLSAIFHQSANRDRVIAHFEKDVGEALLRDVDGQGHDVRWWMRNMVARSVLVNGWCGVLVDMPSADSPEPRLPYARVIDPTRLWDWEIDPETGLFTYALIMNSSDRWTIWLPDMSTEVDEKGNVLAVKPHDFGVVPLFVVLNTPGSMTGHPSPFGLSLIRDVSRIARHILDLCSELDENERKTLFSMLWWKTEPPKKKTAAPADVIGGVNYYLMTAAEVRWLASPVEIPVAFRDQILFWIEQILRTAGMWTGMENLQEKHSGVAIAWFVSDKKMRVRTKIGELEAGENRLWSWFSFMLGAGKRDIVVPESLQLVEWPPDYSILPVAEELEECKSIVALAEKLKAIFEGDAGPLLSGIIEWLAIKLIRTIHRDAGLAPESQPLIARLRAWLEEKQQGALVAESQPPPNQPMPDPEGDDDVR